MKIALIQHKCTNQYQQNLNLSTERIRQAVHEGAQLIVLQELHTHPYFCVTEDPSHFDLAETIPGPTSNALSILAREFGVVIVGSIFEHRAAGIYHNTAVVLDRNGQIAGIYRKMHVPDDPGYFEKYYFTPGDLGFRPIKTSLGQLGVLICWDQWFPEAARLMAISGAQVLIYPSAIGWDPSDDTEEQKRQKEAWITIQRSHAIANSIPVLCCNRVGMESYIKNSNHYPVFWGSSFACGPRGEMIVEASHDKEAVIVVELSLRRTEQIRRHWPFVRDRRIDAYKELQSLYVNNSD